MPLLGGPLPADLPADVWADLIAPFDGTGRAALIGIPLGSVDAGYTNSVIGLARAAIGGGDADEMLARIQNDLFDLGADLCTVMGKARRGEKALRIVPAQTRRLEQEIDAMNAELSPLNSFVLPGGSLGSAWLHLARTVSRRAERKITQLAVRKRVNPEAIAYINRLSDHLFVLARRLNGNGSSDVLWVPGGTRQSR